jgi:hypothetical protein
MNVVQRRLSFFVTVSGFCHVCGKEVARLFLEEGDTVGSMER